MAEVKKYVDEKGLSTIWTEVLAKLGTKANVGDLESIEKLLEGIPEESTVAQFVVQKVSESTGAAIEALTDEEILEILNGKE